MLAALDLSAVNGRAAPVPFGKGSDFVFKAGGGLRLGAESVRGYVCERPAIRRAALRSVRDLFLWVVPPRRAMRERTSLACLSQDAGEPCRGSIKGTEGSGLRMHRACAAAIVRVRQQSCVCGSNRACAAAIVRVRQHVSAKGPLWRYPVLVLEAVCSLLWESVAKS